MHTSLKSWTCLRHKHELYDCSGLSPTKEGITHIFTLNILFPNYSCIFNNNLLVKPEPVPPAKL